MRVLLITPVQGRLPSRDRWWGRCRVIITRRTPLSPPRTARMSTSVGRTSSSKVNILNIIMNISSKYSLFPGCERPKLKQTNSNSSISEEVKTPKGILKPAVTPPVPGVKPPVPSRTKINEILRGGSNSSDECLGEYLNVFIPYKSLINCLSHSDLLMGLSCRGQN